MKRIISLLLVAVMFASIMGVASEQPASATSWDCTVLLFMPHSVSRGWWRPKSTPHGKTVEEWFDHCSGRFRVRKKNGPQDYPQGNWAVGVQLNPHNCSYRFDEGATWMADAYGFKKARIHISPYPYGG